MTSEADFDVLRKAGVSEKGIDFISRLLRREPNARMKEEECFQHPWIVDVPDEFDYMDVDGAPIKELEASLAAVDEGLDFSDIDIGDSYDEDLDWDAQVEVDRTPSENGQAKRQRLAEQIDPSDEILIAHPSGEIRYPSLPNIESVEQDPSVHIERATAGQRLFGEITESDLRSSGVIVHNLRGPLEIRDFRHQFPSVGGSDYLSTSGGSTTSHGSLTAAAQTHQEHRDRNPDRLGTSDASLQGAEELVGQLRMESPKNGRSRTSNSPTSTEDAPARVASLPIKVADTNQNSEDEDTPKKDSVQQMHGFSRRIELSLPVSFDSQTNRIIEDDDNHLTHESTKSVDQVATLEPVAATDELTGVEAQRSGNQEMQSTPNGATASKAKDMSHDSKAVSGIEEATAIAKPAAPLGKLTTLPGSIVDCTILLESRMTSWGRGSKATIRYADPMDRRIPTYALELTFWTPSIEARIAAGEDWWEIPNVMTILSTKTSKCIWVNDVELRKESPSKDAYLFGKLYTGDIVTVYRHRDKFLKFKCEFYHGESVETRPIKEKGFVVEMARKVRGRPVRGETWKTIHGVTAETVIETETGVYAAREEVEGKI
jgi:hypothetical protein